MPSNILDHFVTIMAIFGGPHSRKQGLTHVTRAEKAQNDLVAAEVRLKFEGFFQPAPDCSILFLTVGP
jgi:hypothetical protein